jgi:hypothetical protein
MMHPTSSSRFSFPVLCSHKIIIEKTGEPMSTVICEKPECLAGPS